jgi:hypothetical protein
MDHHLEAWQHVEPHLFGTVLEVALRTPWGFKQDRADIENITVEQYLSRPMRFDTILFHILLGEGLQSMKTFKDCITKAKSECVNLVILEHDPIHWGFNYDIESCFPYPHCAYENWGRNFLTAASTFKRLKLNLSDSYVKQALKENFVSPSDHGIDPNHLVYIKTSESPIDFSIPSGTAYWVIGGGLCFESMQSHNYNILFDLSLRQCLYAGLQCDEPIWKLERIWPEVTKVLTNFDWPVWREVRSNGVFPAEIHHCKLENLPAADSTVYVFTIDTKHWIHLAESNNIIEAFTTRNLPKLHLKGTFHEI